MRHAALYLRVSTDKQTTENQERDLRAVAQRSGWDIVQVYSDHGVSSAKAVISVRNSTPCFAGPAAASM